MIGVERIQRVLRIIGASQSVQNGMGAISANFIAPSDSGKSQLMLSALPPGARVLNDCTTITLNGLMTEKSPPKYIVVPDFNVVISHKPTVSELTMAMLLALMGEGVTELYPGLRNEIRVAMTRVRTTGIRMALLTGMTPEMFHGKRGKWRSTGLLRRMVPINYAYTRRTAAAIQDSIQKGGDVLHYRHVKTSRLKPLAVDIPPHYQRALRELSEQVVDQLCWSQGDKREGRATIVRAAKYPFSAHKTLRQIARAAALLHGTNAVDAEAFRETENVAAFMRYDRPEEV